MKFQPQGSCKNMFFYAGICCIIGSHLDDIFLTALARVKQFFRQALFTLGHR